MDATTVSLVVAGVGLVGVALGAGISTGANFVLALRKELADIRTWRRDHALEAYSDFIYLTNTIFMEAGNCYRCACGSEEQTKNRATLEEKLVEVHRSNHRVLLLASDEVQRPLSALVAGLGEFAMKSWQCPKARDVEVDAENAKVAKINGEFVFAVRKDLGVHEAPDKLW
jgi:hypothetical protein